MYNHRISQLLRLSGAIESYFRAFFLPREQRNSETKKRRLSSLLDLYESFPYEKLTDWKVSQRVSRVGLSLHSILGKGKSFSEKLSRFPICPETKFHRKKSTTVGSDGVLLAFFEALASIHNKRSIVLTTVLCLKAQGLPNDIINLIIESSSFLKLSLEESKVMQDTYKLYAYRTLKYCRPRFFGEEFKFPGDCVFDTIYDIE